MKAQETRTLSNDAVLTQKVTGIWLVDEDSPGGMGHGTGTATFATNGDYFLELKMVVTKGSATGEKSTFGKSGKWLVKDGSLWVSVMKTHSTYSGDKQLTKPEVSTSKIVRVNDQELVYTTRVTVRNAGGFDTTTTLKRSK